MRSDPRVDQAEGLRRLLVRNHTQVITVVAGKRGVGRTSTTINLAAAMACFGKEVLVLDENHAPDNFPGHPGMHAGYDLLDVVRGRCRLDEAASNAGGFPVLSIARAMRSLARLNQAEQQRLENVLTEVISGVDVLLMDAALPALMESPAIWRDCQKAIAPPRLIGHAERSPGQAGVSPGLASGVSLLVVDPTSSGITDSYALIKRLAMENALLQFEIVVNKAPDEQAAMVVFGNIAKVARRNLAAHLEYLGYIPRDDRLRRANQLGMPVVEAFPTAVSAQSYLELAKKVSHLPRRQHEAGGGVRAIIQNLMCQVSQPLRQHGNNAARLAD